jgi:signal transduction histidine kinase
VIETIHVALVEDNPADSRFVVEMLRDQTANYEIGSASTLGSAFDLIEVSKPDIVLLDLGLPDSQGLDTLLRMSEQSPGLPIIVLTGYGDEERAFQALRVGAQDYLVKGEFQGAHLARAIRYAIDRNETESRLRETMHELEDRTEEMESFVYSVSHDLKEPLRTLEAFSQFLLEDYAQILDEQGQDYLGRIGKASGRLKEMIEELLILSRVGRRPHELSRIDVRDIVNQIIASAAARLQERNGRIEIDTDLPEVKADLSRIEQIFGNLINNGLKFNRSSAPVVHVGVVDQTADWATFRVQDNGIGIAPEYHERIFGAFQRLHGREEFEGTGAGLAIVRRAAQAVGGDVWLESEPDRGSTFFVRLPRWREPAEPATRIPRKALSDGEI